MSKIKRVHARQIIDCKCRPCVEVDIETDDGYIGSGAAPTGSSVGIYESHVLRDGDPNEYQGMSVHKAVANVNDIIAPALMGMDVKDQSGIDNMMIEMDGTPEKKNLGGNAIYSVSIAAIRAAAASQRIPLYEYIAGRKIKTVPVPSFNIVNGGKYPDLVQAFNEFIIMPYGAPDIYKAVEMGVNTFKELEKVLTEKLGHKPAVASSYGYAAHSDDPEIVLDTISEAIDSCGYTGKIGFALDCASSEMYDRENGTYLLKGKSISAEALTEYFRYLCGKFDFVFIEDPFDEDDWDAYAYATPQLSRTNILGDDLTVSNLERLSKAYDLGAVDGFILKPNQVGTITEAMEAHEFAVSKGLISVTSGRSGGVVDDVVMDIATGLEIGFIKNGAPRSGERIEKLNFLMRACDLTPDCQLADISDIIKFNK